VSRSIYFLLLFVSERRSVVLAVATANVWKLVAVGLSMHGVRKVFAVRSGIHGSTTSRSNASLNAVATLAWWVFWWRWVVDSILNVLLLLAVVLITAIWSITSRCLGMSLLNARCGIHAIHKAADILLCCTRVLIVVICRLHGNRSLLIWGLVINADIWVKLIWVLRGSWRWDAWVAVAWIIVALAHAIVIALTWARDVVLLSRLRADTSQSSKSWASLLVIIMVIIMISV
jgi:hypothetical protein